ncbi:MFS general substrate transporter [Apiospora rasikravindrae]|uniref:MFS general substrate transporter n=1 Tax=Apiospora rasikravindrae TaxID=990691 RepID=A0ABR1T077_9PEZI
MDPVEQEKADAATVEHRKPLDESSDEALFRHFTSAGEEWHHMMTKKMLRKVDGHLLPVLVLMYLLNFLDRNNLSQARLGTLEADLGMTGTDFNLATSILFVGYLLMQLPSNLALTRVRPSLYLGIAMTVWGVISACQAATHSFGGLVAARFMLGFAEAPFFPGAVFLMSSWYTRSEMAHRIAWFYSGSSLANSRWLFIIEGSITVAAALSSIFILPNYPATTKWLSREEQAYAQWRLIDDTGEADSAGASTLKEGVKLAFRDPRLYLFTLLQHASLLSQSFQYMFPAIVKTLGFGSVETLLITAPIWIGTFLVSLVVTYTSGRFRERSWHIITLMMVSVIGNVIVVSTLNTAVRFFAMFLMPMGAVAAYQIILAWVSNSFPRPLVKRSVCISFANMIGNTANIYGPYMYPASQGPRYLPGGAGTAAVALFTAFLALTVRLVLARENRKLEARETIDSEGNVTTAGGTGHGDIDERAIGFRYVL